MKKRTPKLVLNTETVRVLTAQETQAVVAGKTTAVTCTCPTTLTL
ncbi:MAG TPA: hypothetical protein VH877_10975 [Polyangia bacterium]|jgi:hypothetical protein|nr:hypothetical protein [Polyangia bacterium]